MLGSTTGTEGIPLTDHLEVDCHLLRLVAGFIERIVQDFIACWPRRVTAFADLNNRPILQFVVLFDDLDLSVPVIQSRCLWQVAFCLWIQQV